MRLCEAILSGRYAPGEKLPTQRTLAAELGVNLATVREAIKRLEQLRLVEVRQGDAMRVLDWQRAGGLEVIAHVLLRAGSVDREVLAHILEARRLLLAAAAGLAAERRDADQAARLGELAERIVAEDDDAVAQALDFAFFELLIEVAGNLAFVLILNSMRDAYLAGAAFYRVIVVDRDRLAPLYRDLADAVAAGDAERATSNAQELAGLQERALMKAFA